MRSVAVIAFVATLVKRWDERRALCFARLVDALMRGGRLGVAAIGRHVGTDTTDKHHIKSVDRFLGNDAIALSDVWQSLLGFAVAGKRRVFILLDWTDLHSDTHEALVAAVSYGGRALPVAWVTTKKGLYERSRNKVETTLCATVKALLPHDVELVIVADRGFGRASLFKALRRLGIRFVIRIRRDVHVIDARAGGPVGDRCIKRGQVRDLPDAQYGDNARLNVRCVITFGEGDAKNQPRVPWYLVTDLQPDQLNKGQIVAVYKLRMRIEHNFRDHKSLRFGFQLRSVKLTTAARYDRLLAIGAVAMLLLVYIGAVAEQRGKHRGFKANTEQARTHSLFLLGTAFFWRFRLSSIRLHPLLSVFNQSLEGIG
jgi:Transposase DDE domain